MRIDKPILWQIKSNIMKSINLDPDELAVFLQRQSEWLKENKEAL